MSLSEVLESAASALAGDAEAIRPANGDPVRLLSSLDPDAAARVLGWILAHRHAEGVELADAWALEPAGEEDPAGPRRGLAPQGGSQGAPSGATPSPLAGCGRWWRKAPEPMVSSLPPVEDELSGGYVSPIDPSGTRIAYLLEANPSGGARLFEVVIDDRVGVVDCQVYSSGRSKVRQFLRQVTGRAHFAAAAAPPDSVRARDCPSRRSPGRRSLATPELLGVEGPPH